MNFDDYAVFDFISSCSHIHRRCLQKIGNGEKWVTKKLNERNVYWWIHVHRLNLVEHAKSLHNHSEFDEELRPYTKLVAIIKCIVANPTKFCQLLSSNGLLNKDLSISAAMDRVKVFNFNSCESIMIDPNTDSDMYNILHIYSTPQ